LHSQIKNFQGILTLRRGESLSSAYCRNWPSCDIATPP
jgi:hypothetical protein